MIIILMYRTPDIVLCYREVTQVVQIASQDHVPRKG